MKVQHESLKKEEMEQNELIEQFLLQKWFFHFQNLKCTLSSHSCLCNKIAQALYFQEENVNNFFESNCFISRISNAIIFKTKLYVYTKLEMN